MFGIEIREGVATLAKAPGLSDHLDGAGDLYPPELVERALWEVAAHGGNVSAATASLREAGVHRMDGRPIPRTTLNNWKKKVYRNRYHEILRTKVTDLDEQVAQQAQANALKLGEAMDDTLRVTMAGLVGSSGVEASQILRNIAQARNMEITKSQELRGSDPGSRVARGLEDIAKELQGLGPNIVKIEHENEDGVLELDAGDVEEVAA